MATDASTDIKEQGRRQFAEDLSLIWEMAGVSRMDGRVLGYLMITERPFLSSAQISEALSASSGAVSMATRRLIDTRFIRRHSVPGDRAHYFQAEEDPWGSFLANERSYFDQEIRIIDAALAELEPQEVSARTRLTNGRDYLRWVMDYHHKMLADWVSHKMERDALPSDGDQT